MPFNVWNSFNRWTAGSTVVIEVEGAGTGQYEVTLFNIADLKTVVFNGVAEAVDDVFTIKVNVDTNTIVVGIWLGDDFPNTGGGIYGITTSSLANGE